MNDPEIMADSDQKDTPIDRREVNFQINRRRLILLFDRIIANEPELIHSIVDRILDIARDKWVDQHVSRSWVRVIVRGGSCVIRPLSRRFALRYIEENASETIVDAIIAEVVRMTEKNITQKDGTEVSSGHLEDGAGGASSSEDTLEPEENPLVPIVPKKVQTVLKSETVPSPLQSKTPGERKGGLFNRSLQFAIGGFFLGVLMTGLTVSIVSGFRPLPYNPLPQGKEAPQSGDFSQPPLGQ